MRIFIESWFRGLLTCIIFLIIIYLYPLICIVDLIIELHNLFMNMTIIIKK